MDAPTWGNAKQRKVFIMAELKENPVAPAADTAAVFSETPASPGPKKKKKNKKKLVKRIIAWVLVAALVIGGVFAWKKFFGGDDAGDSEYLTDFAYIGSITSTVSGSGVALAKNNDSLTLVNGGLVKEVLVSEGEQVTAGQQLYTVDSTKAEKTLSDAQKQYDLALRELEKTRTAAEDPNVRAPFAGILLDVANLQAGDEITTATRIATLADDHTLTLSLYFSYAYENDIRVGQKAAVSIPSAMAQVDGTVSEIHKVRRVSEEGAKLFEVVISVSNPGTLTENMVATAVLTTSSGEAMYPYEAGALAYSRTQELYPEVGGVVSSASLYNYIGVSAGESIVSVQAGSVADSITQMEEAVESKKKSVDEAQAALDALNGIAPIDGTVMSLGIYEGMDAPAGTVAVNISDTSTMIINAQIDEMHVSQIKQGMMVDINQWGNTTFGTVESVSLSGEYSNGSSTFPVVISVDNYDGMLMSGSYVEYSFAASQSDNCLLIPIQCVRYVDTGAGVSSSVVFVRADEQPENAIDLGDTFAEEIPEGFWPVPVETGLSDTYSVEIVSGLEEGAEVFTSMMNVSAW